VLGTLHQLLGPGNAPGGLRSRPFSAHASGAQGDSDRSQQ
jgi:hypothetical protein